VGGLQKAARVICGGARCKHWRLFVGGGGFVAALRGQGASMAARCIGQKRRGGGQKGAAAWLCKVKKRGIVGALRGFQAWRHGVAIARRHDSGAVSRRGFCLMNQPLRADSENFSREFRIMKVHSKKGHYF